MEWISSRSSSAPEGPEPVESSRQIIDQILACLKTRMDADQAAFLQRRATTLRHGPGGNNQTFKPAPAGTELKQPELIEESRMFLRRSEEHTSELQSLMRNSYAVFCLKKNKKYQDYKHDR